MNHTAYNLPHGSQDTEVLADGYLHTSGRLIVDMRGQPVRIAGINWFGLEIPMFAPHGLDVRGCEEMMGQMKQLGFNTIRLPFCSQLFDAVSQPADILILILISWVVMAWALSTK